MGSVEAKNGDRDDKTTNPHLPEIRDIIVLLPVLAEGQDWEERKKDAFYIRTPEIIIDSKKDP